MIHLPWFPAANLVVYSFSVPSTETPDLDLLFAKRLLASVAPIFDQLGGSQHLKPIMSGLTAYDKGKSDVMQGYNNVQHHYNRIKRQVPELEL